MKIIKNFYWFWIDWYETETGIRRTLNKVLTEENLNTKDKRYIKDAQIYTLRALWKKLDKEHNQTFYISAENWIKWGAKITKYYEYKWKYYTAKEIAVLTDLEEHTIYSRLSQKWTIKRIMETPLCYNSKFYKQKLITNK